MRVHWVDFSQLSVLWRELDRWDYVESCEYHLTDDAETTTFADVLRATLLAAGSGQDPAWMRVLTRVSHALTARFDTDPDPAGAARDRHRQPRAAEDAVVGQRVGSFFRVCEVLDDEVVLGGDKGYMTFRLSVLLDPASLATTGRRIVATVVVAHHSWFSRAYFLVVKPFHRRLVMPMFIGQLAENLRQR